MNVQLARELAWRDPAAVVGELDDLGNNLSGALESAARLAQRIYPPRIEAGGLAAALRAVARANGVRVEVGGTSERLEPQTAATVYFCWVEALDRVPSGGSASIEVEIDDDDVIFLIQRQGPVVSDGDLLALRDRVEAVGGSLMTVGETALRGRLPRSS